MKETKLSIVIVNYNVKYFLEQCLISVRAAANGLDTEIFVVDNHSTDDSVAYLRPIFPEVIFIENDNNPGFAKANNQAIRLCKGEYILLLNPATVIGENSLRTLCRFMDEHAKAGALGVKMLNGHGAFLPESKRSFPTPWVSFCKLFGLSKLFAHSPRFAAYSLPYLNPCEQHEVEVLAGAFLFLRHAALKKVGLFDESFFMYGEDIDLSYRIRLAGYQNYYIPERILHYKGESTNKGDKKYLHAFYDAMLIFYRKYYPHSGWFISNLIRLTITCRKGYAAWFEKKKWGKEKNNHDLRLTNERGSRAFVICHETHFEQIKQSLSTRFPATTTFTYYQPLSTQPSITIGEFGAIDVIFCYPHITFDQMLLWMDRMADKKITYHIFHIDKGLFISPNS